MLPRGRGSVFFTGATASLRAKGNFAVFGSSKMGLRGIAQGFARELYPKGIHTAHIIVDGVVDGNHGQSPKAIKSANIAGMYWYLHN